MKNPKEIYTPWSCDTFAALPDSTASGFTTLFKNSDRPPFDCQPLMRYPRQKHTQGAELKLSYISIPQVEETYATIGSSPYWCWGYEEGINEFGVAIGNEAIFTKDCAEMIRAEESGKPQKLGLVGMELLRLGLERGKTAKEALDTITKLVETYGQWGSGVPAESHAKGAYNNSYMIADKAEVWILETVGHNWIAKRLTSGLEAISNEPSIRKDYTAKSENLVPFAADKKWLNEGDFDFAFTYTDFLKPLQLSHIRSQRNRQLLREATEKGGKVDVAWGRRMLRDHYEDTFLQGPYFNAALPDFLSVCMHSSPAGFTWGNTASSAIFELPNNDDHLSIMWWSPVTPCTGLYIPAFIDGESLPKILSAAGAFGKKEAPPPSATPDSSAAGSYWWMFRDLLDLIKGDELGTKFPDETAQKIFKTTI